MVNGGPTCPFHQEIQQRVRSIESVQLGRKCQDHEARVASLERSEDRIVADNEKQWEAINAVRRLVYMGAGAAGVLAFLGSIVGQIIKR